MCFFSGFVSKENSFNWQPVVASAHKHSDCSSFLYVCNVRCAKASRD